MFNFFLVVYTFLYYINSMKLEKLITEDQLILQDEHKNALAHIDYTQKDDTLYINKVFVSDVLRGQGIAGVLMENFISFAQDKKVVPICSYAVNWMEKHNLA